jgi:3-dehydroquinate synthetase
MPIPKFEIGTYFEALKRDKKNIGSEVKVILTSGLGEMFKTTLNLDEKNQSIISEYFEMQLYKANL